MRVFAEETWGIFKENVIGTRRRVHVRRRRDRPRRARVLGGLDVWRRASPSTSSRRPAGCPCSPAETPTSTSRCSRPPSSRVLVNHDDEDREFAYTSGAEASLAKANELGWTVVSMKNDWRTVF